MREVYIGGIAQGKLDYVRRVKSAEGVKLRELDCAVWQTGKIGETGENGETERAGTIREAGTIYMQDFSEEQEGVPTFYHFHEWVRKLVRGGMDAEAAFSQFWERYPNWIIISDEVGNGIVPMERAEREYRECLGRILIEAAKRADRVERVICGLGQRIK
ncbi:MAG: bifunctional adenosylcobinamide kinase/adenosylcobinamide-phosphate guanylyltransferase [Lachnospiraceae bacterium]|nr:bifunctional adenosylcobinamide kinase/adenosylcobinamide-phosphate guanylyltransferase [Lachnospiraceae bacterium]